MTAAEITLGAAVCVLWAVFLILSAIGTVVTYKAVSYTHLRAHET